MSDFFLNFKKRVGETKEWLKKEFSSIRTGRAGSAILDSVLVDSYGTKMPINQLAAITIEDAKTLRVAPWDSSQIKNIEKAITNSNLNLSAVADEKGVRVIFPELNSETRVSLMKVAKTKLEEAKIATRKERDQTWNDLQVKEKSGEISEDDKFRLKEKMQEIVDEINKEFAEMYERKEKEIMS